MFITKLLNYIRKGCPEFAWGCRVVIQRPATDLSEEIAIDGGGGGGGGGEVRGGEVGLYSRGPPLTSPCMSPPPDTPMARLRVPPPSMPMTNDTAIRQSHPLR